jgi:hypothetical protein
MAHIIPQIAGALLASTLLLWQSPAAACKAEPFRGATSREGAATRMAVVNNGQPCSIVNYGVPEERSNPAHSGRITVQARNGTAEFSAPAASYTPKPGFVGDDEFTYEAMATGRGNANLTLKVRVQVKVMGAP